MMNRERTAQGVRLARCEVCARLSSSSLRNCPRCRAALYLRKPNSIARTWALLISASILYVPANVLPVMTVVYFGSGSPDTILGGVLRLLRHGEWAVGLVVLVASVVVPLAKLLVLAFLLLSVQTRSHWRPRDRTRIYRVIEVIGRWSMLDIFVISVLVALVQLGVVATIEAGSGATSFGAVIVLSILAARSFDPRLIWDCVPDSARERSR